MSESDLTPEMPAAPSPDNGATPAGESVPEAVEAGGADTSYEMAELRDRYMRVAADFENFKRRKTQELGERVRYAPEQTVRALLPVLDNLRRAVDSAPEGADAALLDGVRMVTRQFDEALAQLGVTPVFAEGEPFDPALHEAVLGEESPDVEQETVVLELQRGYRLHDRLLRPALVKVAHPVPSPSEQ